MKQSQIQKKTPQKELVSTDAPPLSFANFNIKNLNDIKHIPPRSGKRKPIIAGEQEDIKDEKKKSEGTQDISQGQTPVGVDETQNKEGELEEQEKQKEREEKEKIKEQRGIPAIIRTIQPVQNTFAMSQNFTQSIGGKGSLQKLGDNPSNKAKQKTCVVKLVQTILILSYNKIAHLNNFYCIIDSVMADCKNLQWIDISHNHLETLDYNFQDFPHLRSLYLHGNYIKDLKDLQQLGQVQSLCNLTVHGNPIDSIANFRLYIIGMLPQLRKLDSVLISKKELDNSLVWKANFHMINPPMPRIITRPQDSQGTQS